MSLENLAVTIASLTPASRTDKGLRTWEWKHGEQRQITISERKIGEIVGDHFHKGTDPSKNPELTLLLHGKIRALFYHIDAQFNSELVCSMVIDASNAPQVIEVPPLVGHTLVPITDCIFLEYRVTHFDSSNPDCYPLIHEPSPQ